MHSPCVFAVTSQWMCLFAVASQWICLFALFSRSLCLFAGASQSLCVCTPRTGLLAAGSEAQCGTSVGRGGGGSVSAIACMVVSGTFSPNRARPLDRSTSAFISAVLPNAAAALGGSCRARMRFSDPNRQCRLLFPFSEVGALSFPFPPPLCRGLEPEGSDLLPRIARCQARCHHHHMPKESPFRVSASGLFGCVRRACGNKRIYTKE